MNQMLKILEILKKYTNSDYLFFAEHDVIGFMVDFDIISSDDIKKLNDLNVFVSEEYNSLVMYV